MKFREYPKRPIAGVGVCVLKQNKILLARRRNPPKVGEWSLPGGVQEVGETIKECALREVKEETGLNVRILKLIDTVDSIIFDDSGKIKYHYILIDFVAEPISGNLLAGDDASDVKWFYKNQIIDLKIWDQTKKVVSQAFDSINQSKKNCY